MSNSNDGRYPLWYKDAIIYELHIKAFKDGNNDGIGDFKGLFEKLDYLENLGVTAIWLLPFYPSPLRDDGYDIQDYYKINPSYGELENLKEFIAEAHKRGLKVITELVLNHTSDQHEWFQRARKAPKGSPERDYYVWSDDPQKYKDTRIIFTDYEPSNWTWDPVADQYFWHRFFHHQPDLNFDNPAVQEEVFKILDYWINMGVDGFRLDAIPYLFEREGTNCENLPETHVFLKKLRKHVDENYDNIMLLAEANMWPEDSASYFGDGDECHMNYHFPIMPRLFMSLKMEDRYPIVDIFEQTPEIPENCQWAMFLRNHDELTLEMVTDEERNYMYKVYAENPQAQINVGIRHRLAPLLENDRNKIELMNILLFSMPGTPVVYYGDEIGMGDNYYLGDRDGVRTPMQWTPGRNAGFSTCNPQGLYLPVVIDPSYNYQAVNVENQETNRNSLLNWTRRAIRTRKKFQAFGRGSMEFLAAANKKILAFIRQHENETILVVTNLSRYAQAAEIDLGDYEGMIPKDMFSKNSFPAIKKDPYLFTLQPYGYYWLSLDKPEVELDESDIPVLEVEQWDELHTRRKNVKLLERVILPFYLYKQTWFAHKNNEVEEIKMVQWVQFPMEGQDCYFLVIKANLFNELPQNYLLQVSFASGKKAAGIQKDHSDKVIAELSIAGEKGVLYDPIVDEAFQKALPIQICKGGNLKSDQGETSFLSTEIFEKELSKLEGKLEPVVVPSAKTHTVISYNDQFVLKLYRQLDNGANRDVEISRFLSVNTDFQQVPTHYGSLEYHLHGLPNITLGIVQRYEENKGTGWDYVCNVTEKFLQDVGSVAEATVQGLINVRKGPLSMEDIPEDVKGLLNESFCERIVQIGQRTAEMHKALCSEKVDRDFEPEPFSTHYQRSLYSSLKSLVRSSLQRVDKSVDHLDDIDRSLAINVFDLRDDIIERFKGIFDHKIDTFKIRNHGDYHLGQILFTGRDFIILDFEGDSAHAISERRLKESAFIDVASMIYSLHFSIYYPQIDRSKAINDEIAEGWFHAISGLFIKAYIDELGDHELMPNEADFFRLIDIFLLEKAVFEMRGLLRSEKFDFGFIPMKRVIGELSI